MNTPRRTRRATALTLTAVLAAGSTGLVALPASAEPEVPQAAGLTVSSPDGTISIALSTTESGQLQYAVARGTEQLVAPSDLGLELTDRVLGDDVTLVAAGETSTHDETWETVIGTDATVRNHYTERTVSYSDDGVAFDVVVRAYDDGVAVRYDLAGGGELEALEIVDELTEFALVGNPDAWWTAQSYDDDEAVWQQTSFADMESANLPATFRYGTGTHLSIHEADLVDYAALTVTTTDTGSLRADLVPTIGRDAAVVREDFGATPWRAITIAGDAGGLIESHLLENLNPPLDTELFGSETEARTWVQDSTYVGIWWMLQQEIATWEEGPRHGATTARIIEYIDFAAGNGIGAVLAEGWNKGWEGHWGDQDFDAPTDDLDLPAVLKHAEEKGVEFVAHNETGANPWNYEQQIEDGLFETYQDWGVNYIKTGYVGSTPNIPSREDALDPDFDITSFTPKHHRYDQAMINHFRYVLTEAAKNQINVNCHECVHGTGESRTFPNAISREAVRGQEWDAFSEGNSPEHTLILPFTRMLSGPMDYTPGVMNVTMNSRNPGSWRVHTTAAKQLAQAVTYFSGVQMAADLPENYELNRGIEFYDGLPASWDETRVLSGEIGEHLVTARRSGETWYVGAMTGEDPAVLTYSLDFLGEGTWVAQAFTDDASADYDTNPNPISGDEFTVTSADTLTADLLRSGGQAVRLRPATEADADLPAYVSPALTVTEIRAPDTAQPGDIVNVTVVARNQGSVPVREDITLEVSNGESQLGTIAANQGVEGSLRFQVRLAGEGSVTLTVGDASKVITLVSTVEVPQNLRIVASTSAVISLEWDQVADATGYELFRRTEDGRYGEVPRARVPAGVTSFRDARLDGGSYRYVLRAIKDGERSAASGEVGGIGELVATLSDPKGDDNGPGSYLYPQADAFSAGAFDITAVDVYDSGHAYSFVTTIAGSVTNPFGGNAISLQHLELYLGDGDAEPAPARAGTNLHTTGGWSHVVVADGRFDAAGVYDTDNVRVSEVTLSASAARRTITVTVPKAALPEGFDPSQAQIGVAMFANVEGGEGINYIRPVYDWSAPGNPDWLSQWRPGGGLGELDGSLDSKDSDTRDANAFDIVVGEGQAQAELLDWNRDGGSVLPLVPLTSVQP
ncbi:MAG: glycoside hydrolase family 97 catalytic domain-containing protein [Cellulomonadaceae bacterium]